MWKSIKFVTDLGIYYPHISVATPYPGTELYEICKNNGYLKPDFSYDDLHIRSYSISTPDWHSEELKQFVGEAEQYLYSKLRKELAEINKPDHILSKFQSIGKLGRRFFHG